MAHLALSLGSDTASYISGDIIACDGSLQGMLGGMISGAVGQGWTGRVLAEQTRRTLLVGMIGDKTWIKA